MSHDRPIRVEGNGSFLTCSFGDAAVLSLSRAEAETLCSLLDAHLQDWNCSPQKITCCSSCGVEMDDEGKALCPFCEAIEEGSL